MKTRQEKKAKAKHMYECFLKALHENLGSGITFDHTLDYMGNELFGNKWAGIYMRDDRYPESKYCIVNTDTRGGQGVHWVAVGDGYQYDSFGRKNILGNDRLRDTDHEPEQVETETDCGSRCLAWLCTLNMLGIDTARLI
jgi:hypothetical protein